MRVPHSRAVQQRFSVSMTPMIDVVFLLLIFFVCTASFEVPELTLPGPIATGGDNASLPAESEELEYVLIKLAQESNRTSITVNGQSCSSHRQLTELLSALAAIDNTLPVILDIDGRTPLGSAIDVYDSCRLEGFGKIQFAASRDL